MQDCSQNEVSGLRSQVFGKAPRGLLRSKTCDLRVGLSRAQVADMRRVLDRKAEMRQYSFVLIKHLNSQIMIIENPGTREAT